MCAQVQLNHQKCNLSRDVLFWQHNKFVWHHQQTNWLFTCSVPPTLSTSTLLSNVNYSCFSDQLARTVAPSDLVLSVSVGDMTCIDCHTDWQPSQTLTQARRDVWRHPKQIRLNHAWPILISRSCENIILQLKQQLLLALVIVLLQLLQLPLLLLLWQPWLPQQTTTTPILPLLRQWRRGGAWRTVKWTAATTITNTTTTAPLLLPLVVVVAVLAVHQLPRSTQPCIPPGSLNRVLASAGVKAGKSPLPGGR